MEVDPLFVGPAALSKAYRFVGDPRDAQQFERLKDLSEDPHGIYDCTHCFNCIDACPKGVDPMSQIMRLRRVAGSDHDIVDGNNGYRHEHAFVKNIQRNGILHESDLLADSYGGKFNPSAGRELVSGLPTAVRGLAKGKMTVKKLLLHEHKAAPEIKRIFETVEGREERVELNLYVSGYEDEPEETGGAAKETKPAGEKAQAGPEAAGAAGREPAAESSVPETAEAQSAPEVEGTDGSEAAREVERTDGSEDTGTSTESETS
jgi:succinate dehydrogenase / fumarate reductase iron-sulfur subunit